MHDVDEDCARERGHCAARRRASVEPGDRMQLPADVEVRDVAEVGVVTRCAMARAVASGAQRAPPVPCNSAGARNASLNRSNTMVQVRGL